MNKEKKLRIISFENPYPPDYGGAIDVYFKIKSLHKQGVKIWLHYFSRYRYQEKDLSQYCEKIFHYPRRLSPLLFLSATPFTILSRHHQKLLDDIRSTNEYIPILFEGLHTTWLVKKNFFPHTPKFLRLHNLENLYYLHLARQTRHPLYKAYLYLESAKFSVYQKTIFPLFDAIFSISEAENAMLQQHNIKSFWIPPFHPFEQIRPMSETEDFILYHGNLSIAENEKAASFIIREVAPHVHYPFVIAGNGASSYLRKLSSRYSNIQLISPIDYENMQDLIKKARLNLLLTFQDTGIKLKLLYALFHGNLVLANMKMLHGTGLHPFVYTASENAAHIIASIEQLMQIPFPSDEIIQKKKEALHLYSPVMNSKKILDYIESLTPAST